MGVTSVRDPGNDDVRTIDRRTPRGRGRAAVRRTSIRRRSSTARDRTPRRWPTSRPARPRRSRSSTRRRPTASPASSSTARFNPAWLPASIARGAQARAPRARPHSGRHPAAGRDQRRLRRGHAHQLDDDAGDAGQRDPGLERHHALRRAGTLREGRRPRRRRRSRRSSATMASKQHLQRSDDGRVREPVRARRMATCRRPTRRSSARCRRPPSAASGPAASRCRRI